MPMPSDSDDLRHPDEAAARIAVRRSAAVAASEQRWSLWHRPSRRCRWRLVGRAASQLEALALMTAENGHWLAREGFSDPNEELPR